MRRNIFLPLSLLASALLAADSDPTPAPAPSADRVGFPKAYAETFQVLRTVTKEKELKVVTVYGNGLAASVSNSTQLPYPYGSIIVMETVGVLTNALAKNIVANWRAKQAAERARRPEAAQLELLQAQTEA